MFQKRNTHYCLNYFNTCQLTYLCKKLSCLEENDFPDQVYQLLDSVAGNVSRDVISVCLEEVIKIKDKAEQVDTNYVQGKAYVSAALFHLTSLSPI